MKFFMKKRWMYIGIISIILIGILVFRNKMHADSEINNNLKFAVEKSLPIPPILEDLNSDPDKAEFRLTAQSSTVEFVHGKKTKTLGYNGSYLGPVLRVSRGEEVSVRVINQLNEPTTLHWHGLELPGEMDGGPHSIIRPNSSWVSKFSIDQQASTLWYHPHFMHKTGEQVYKGLAGLIYVDDENSKGLEIPKEYGVDDFPLIIQDRRIDEEGQVEYDLDRMDVMHGFQGNMVLINGAISPYLEVPRGKVRFRVLNGSNGREYKLLLSNKEHFYQIGSDGGLLESPVEMNELYLGPGERAEIIVDFSNYKRGDSILLKTGDYSLMEFKVTGEKVESADIPKSLVSIEKMHPAQASVTRMFVLQGMGQNVNINGKQMDMERIDEQVKVNTTEIWKVTNQTTGMMGMAHPFHAHGTQFQILERDGKEPPMNERGWKDTIMIQPGETVKIIAAFRYKGLFMYHCHILEHEDSGMMGQFLVE